MKIIYFDRNPPSALTAEVHYERLVEMFGKKGYFCRTIPELQEALRQAFQVFPLFIYIVKCNRNRMIENNIQRSFFYRKKTL